MSWPDFVAAGGGVFELRLVIEGWPVIFCTGGLEAGFQGDGRRRINGMLREGIKIDDQARMAEGDSDRAGFSVSLVDLDAEGTASFTGSAVAVSWLVGNLAPADPLMVVQDTSQFLIGDVLHLGTEAVSILGIPSPVQLQVNRAQWDTIDQRHTSAAGEGAVFPEVSTSPTAMTGRRCYLYAHTPDELTAADVGTLIYRGVMSEEPRLRSVTTWALEVDSLLSLLDQDVGADLSDLELRGIYYPAGSCLRVSWTQGPSAFYADAWGGTTADLWFTGFYADQAAFTAALNTAIAAEMVTRGHNGRLVARHRGNDDWWFEYTADAVAPRYVTVNARSPIDGITEPLMVDGAGEPARTAASTIPLRVQWAPTGAREMLTLYGYADADTIPESIEPRAVPRASWRGSRSIEPGATVAAPNNVIYLARAYQLNANDQLTITARQSRRESEEAASTTPIDFFAVVQSVTAATGAIELRDTFAGDPKPLPALAITRQWGPKIETAAVFGFGATDLGGFRDHLVSFSPAAIAGTMPLITSTDFPDISATVAEAANGRHYLTGRLYIFGKPVKLRDVLTHECRMLGCYLTTTASGALTIKRIRAAAPTDLLATVIDATNRVVSNGFGTVEISPDAVINRASISTGYNRSSNQHEGPTFVIREVRSISRLRREHTLEIEPKARSEHDITTDDTVEDVPGPAFGVMSDRYLVASVDVTWQCFDVAIGDSVSLDAPQLPYAGARGLLTQGVVVGRLWDVAKAAGSLDVLLLDQNFAGYAPSGRIVGTAGGGANWSLTLEANRYAPAGVPDALFFLVGYQVQLVEWNAAAPSILTGVVTGVAGNVVDVTLTAPWGGPGPLVYNLLFDDYATATPDQQSYCYDASSVAVLGGATRARVFAP